MVLIVEPTTSALAQRGAADREGFRAAFTLNADAAVPRQVADVREYVRTKKWNQAAELLVRIARERGGSIVAVDDGWYVNVADYCNMLAADLPAEGLAAYRKQVDRQAKAWYDEAVRTGDERLLHRIARQAFCSSWGNDAVQQLALSAWKRGQVGAARRYWTLLLPKNGNGGAGRLWPLRYPGRGIDAALLEARLILCDVIAGDRGLAEAGLKTFQKRFPEAKGEIAGESGNLVKILTEVVRRSSDWKPFGTGAAWPTFGGNFTRSAVAADPIDVGAPRWSRPLRTRFLRPKDAVGPAARFRYPATFPVLWKDRVFVADADRVYGYQLGTGAAAFADNANNSDAATLYSVAALDSSPAPTEDVAGFAHFTLTVSDGKLFARMGSPITGRAADETRAVRSRLVCLDLERGEGKLVWKVESRQLGAGWEFEGSPVVRGDRLYSAVRLRNGGTQLSVAAFDAQTGKLLWTSRIGSAIAAGDAGVNTISHLLLAESEGRLFLSTNAGAIAAIEARDGRLLWAVTYPARNESDDDRTGPATCLVDRGTVFAAPADSDRLLAIDAESGAVLWRKKLRGDVRHFIGVRDNRLIVSGERLWGLEPATGRVRWNVGFENPAGYGFGRGAIAGDRVYWPLRKEILVAECKTGRLVRRIRLAGLRGGRGGNLTIIGDRLIVAEPQRLRIYGTQAGFSK